MELTQFLIVIVVVAVLVAGAVAVRARSRSAGPPPPAARPVAGGLRPKLAKTRSALAGVFRRGALDEAFWAELEEALIAADVGVDTAGGLVEEVRRSSPGDADEARSRLEEAIVELLADRDRAFRLEGNPAVVLVVGVNGTGKTTTIAKIAKRLVDEGHGVVLAAADTFRAAAVEQLRTWGERIGVPVVAGASGADPAAVAYDGLARSRDVGADVLMVDTAGRLQSKSNLMDELAKIKRVLEKDGGVVGEVLLVLDGTTGQNGIAQAEAFRAAVDVTGLVITKLDGTARGGVAVAVERSLGIPVKFIGVGEAMDDLVPFEPQPFVEALLEP